VECEPGVELLVINLLMAAGFEVLVPTHQPDPKREPVPALGRYLLVRFDQADDGWRQLPAMLRECRARLLGDDGERPAAISDAAVERLLAQLAAQGGPKRVVQAPLAVGVAVRVVAGLLAGHVGRGVVEWSDGRDVKVRFERVVVPVTMAQAAVEVVA
jgi:transcription antitermination factor NusG